MKPGDALNKRGRLLSKPCPKCGGTLYMDRDFHGWYEQCLQCGLMNDLEILYEDRKKVRADR